MLTGIVVVVHAAQTNDHMMAVEKAMRPSLAPKKNKSPPLRLSFPGYHKPFVCCLNCKII